MNFKLLLRKHIHTFEYISSAGQLDFLSSVVVVECVVAAAVAVVVV